MRCSVGTSAVGILIETQTKCQLFKHALPLRYVLYMRCDSVFSTLFFPRENCTLALFEDLTIDLTLFLLLCSFDPPFQNQNYTLTLFLSRTFNDVNKSLKYHFYPCLFDLIIPKLFFSFGPILCGRNEPYPFLLRVERWANRHTSLLTALQIGEML